MNTLPPGFHYFPNFISEEEEQFLIKEIKLLDWKDIKMHGVIAKRKVVHFGMNYLYSQRNAIALKTAIPEFLTVFFKRISKVIKVNPDKIVQVLISKYPIDAGIGWHTDAEIFGDSVFGISLLSPCTMKFRKLMNKHYIVVKTDLEPRSGYVLSGAARLIWQHAIQPVKFDRYSITFRTLKKT